MSRPVRIAPSILAADFARLDEEIGAVTRGGADLIHWDVMDGTFVDNLTFGAPVIRALRPHSPLPFDTHLMVQNPAHLFPEFMHAGCNTLTIHPEASDDIIRDLQSIRALKMQAGIAFNPDTPLDLLPALLPYLDHVLIMTVRAGFGGQAFMPLFDKVRTARTIIETAPHLIDLAVDGGINKDNAPILVTSGATILVAGTAIFSGPRATYQRNISALKGH